MTVSAYPANLAPFAASLAEAPHRGGPDVRAGTYAYTAEDLVTGWHRHELHQIEYAFRGVVEVETATARYLLPPQKAVWIPAGVAHRATLRQVSTMSVFFDESMFPSADGRARVLTIAPVFREMIVYADRWPITRTRSDPAADSYFTTLAHLVTEWLDDETPFSLPTSTDPLIAAIMTYTKEHLGHVPISELCRSVGVSERTLRRQFQDATGMTWRQYLLQTRLLSAMALLMGDDRSIVDIANTVGFSSPSAFTRAFTHYTGETPSTYRQRPLESGLDHENSAP